MRGGGDENKMIIRKTIYIHMSWLSPSCSMYCRSVGERKPRHSPTCRTTSSDDSQFQFLTENWIFDACNDMRQLKRDDWHMWWLSDHDYDLEHDQVDQVDNGDNKTHKKETLKCTSLGGRVTQYWCPKCFSWSLTMMFWTHFPPVPSWWRVDQSSRGGRWWSRRTCSTHPSTRWNPAEMIKMMRMMLLIMMVVFLHVCMRCLR